MLGTLETMFVYQRGQWSFVPFTGSRPDQEYFRRRLEALVDPRAGLVPEGTTSVVFPMSQWRNVNYQKLMSSRLDGGQASGAVTSRDPPGSKARNVDSQLIESQLRGRPLRDYDCTAKHCTWRRCDRLQGIVHSRGRSSLLLWRNLK